MDSKNWLSDLKNAKKTCMKQDNLKKVHYLFPNGQEMVEEYNTETEVLLRRAWKLNAELRDKSVWDIEIGDPEPRTFNEDNLIISENSNQPMLFRRVTKRNLEWRIRNLSYPAETYSIIADRDNNCVIVKTSNRKYYKKIEIPELKRVGLLPEQSRIDFTHKYNTLIITYKKPQEVIDLEKRIWDEVISQLNPKESLADLPNPDNCKPS